MGNRVTITIGGKDYTLLAQESAEYVRGIAARVDGSINELVQDGRISILDAAVLTAVNLADELTKETEISENLRTQMKEYLEESTRLKLELAEAKREIFKLQNKKES